MKIYGNGAFDSHITSYEEDMDSKIKRLNSDIKDIAGLINGSSMTDRDKDILFTHAAKLLLNETKGYYHEKTI